MWRQHHICGVALLTLGHRHFYRLRLRGHLDLHPAGAGLPLLRMFSAAKKMSHILVHVCVYITRTCKE